MLSFGLAGDTEPLNSLFLKASRHPRRALWGGDVVDVLTWRPGVLPKLTLSPTALAHIPSHPVPGPKIMPFSL